MNILAIDPATVCGWAHSGAGSGVWDLSVRADESNGMRLLRLRAKLNAAREAGLDLVVFEAGRNLKYGNAVRVAAQLQGVIELWCTEHEIAYRGYSPSEIKKHATGSGNATKDRMLETARETFADAAVIDHNHADALWLLDLAMMEYGA